MEVISSSVYYGRWLWQLATYCPGCLYTCLKSMDFQSWSFCFHLLLADESKQPTHLSHCYSSSALSVYLMHYFLFNSTSLNSHLTNIIIQMFIFGLNPLLVTSITEAASQKKHDHSVDFYRWKGTLSLLICCIIYTYSVSLSKSCIEAPTLLQSMGILTWPLKKACSSLENNFVFMTLSDRETPTSFAELVYLLLEILFK